MRFTLLAVGTMKDPAIKSLFQTYRERLGRWSLDVVELPTADNAAENAAILKKLDALTGDVIVCDERGETLSTRQLAQFVDNRMNTGTSRLTVVVGGAEGLNDAIRARGQLVLSLGRLTWPHMLVRVLLAEQIYRCQQVLAGHPYHKD